MATHESRLSTIRFKLPEASSQHTDAAMSMRSAVRGKGPWLAAGLIVVAAAAWSWRAVMTRDATAVPAVPAQPVAPNGDVASESVSGRVAPTSIPAAVAVAPPDALAAMPATAPSLQLSLRGVLATGPKGKAIVAGRDGREYVVSVGSRVATDASVQAINDDHLIVMQGTKSRVLRLQAAYPPVVEPQSPPRNRVVTVSGVSIDVDRLAAEGVDSLTAAQKSAAIGANLVIDDSAVAVMPSAEAAAGNSGHAAAHGEPGQRFIKNKPR